MFTVHLSTGLYQYIRGVCLEITGVTIAQRASYYSCLIFALHKRNVNTINVGFALAIRKLGMLSHFYHRLISCAGYVCVCLCVCFGISHYRDNWMERWRISVNKNPNH